VLGVVAARAAAKKPGIAAGLLFSGHYSLSIRSDVIARFRDREAFESLPPLAAQVLHYVIPILLQSGFNHQIIRKAGFTPLDDLGSTVLPTNDKEVDLDFSMFFFWASIGLSSSGFGKPRLPPNFLSISM
jgi:hypothetical protein